MLISHLFRGVGAGLSTPANPAMAGPSLIPSLGNEARLDQILYVVGVVLLQVRMHETQQRW